MTTPLFNSDPDYHFFQTFSGNVNSFSSDYYHEDSFNGLCLKHAIKSEGLSFIHLNIRSCNKNFSEFDHYLQSLNIKFPFIGLSETWLSDNTFSYFVNN